MLIRPPHGNHGGQNMASGSASAYTTLGSMYFVKSVFRV